MSSMHENRLIAAAPFCVFSLEDGWQVTPYQPGSPRVGKVGYLTVTLRSGLLDIVSLNTLLARVEEKLTLENYILPQLCHDR